MNRKIVILVLYILSIIIGLYSCMGGVSKQEDILIKSVEAQNSGLEINRLLPKKSSAESDIVCVLPPYGMKISTQNKAFSSQKLFGDGIYHSAIDKLNLYLREQNVHSEEGESKLVILQGNELITISFRRRYLEIKDVPPGKKCLKLSSAKIKRVDYFGDGFYFILTN
ncbi:hypothetical protein NT239_01755 [Chitinibacter sp. SCUT-21]|uniref:hypothetical protein n=1 Tax=Chitinibacter sp. SCUT-21 TaxID=2970891 RepID=UPI0035A5F055